MMKKAVWLGVSSCVCAVISTVVAYKTTQKMIAEREKEIDIYELENELHLNEVSETDNAEKENGNLSADRDFSDFQEKEIVVNSSNKKAKTDKKKIS